MRRRTRYVSLLFLAFLFHGPVLPLGAVPIQWTVQEGGNGHWYEAVRGFSTWDEANDMAQARSHNGMQGHLVTLTSVEEKAFVWSEVGTARYWLGGYQTDKLLEPDGRWVWVTGETWDYTNWYVGEPNDLGGDEQFLQFWGVEGAWNDNSPYSGWVFKEPGYMLEYESVPVPEPSTMLLFGTGLMGLAGARRRLFP